MSDFDPLDLIDAEDEVSGWRRECTRLRLDNLQLLASVKRLAAENRELRDLIARVAANALCRGEA